MSNPQFVEGDIVEKNDGDQARHRGQILKVLADGKYRGRWFRGWLEREYLDEKGEDLILVKRGGN